ncbi:hypothetical protein IJG26_00220, partial [Candidatus Saccharibacteria bacterium]|nr:hypothetical protein [Candidatus Saccharibacteria bacterium]
NNDQYKTNIGTTTFNVFCNDKDGYSIYAIGYSGDTYGNTEMLYMGNQTPAPSNIVTGTATSGSTSNWAMKLTAVAGTYQATLTNGFGSYRAVPTTYTKAATLTSQTDTTTGSSIQSTYAVFASATQGAGTYQGKVRYTLVHPASHAAPVSFDMAFADAGKTKLNGYYKMQDMTSAICSSINLVDDESQTTLIDSRDNKTYTVSKLRDGNCWMTQNLDLDLDSETTYTNLDTDLGWNGTSYSTASWTPENSTITTSVDDWNYYDYEPESYNPGDLYWNGVLAPGDEDSCEAAGGTWDYWYCGDLDSADYTSSTGNSHYHLGNYYNWPAAIATNDASDYSEWGMIAGQSICPVNWTLAIGGSDYYDMYMINKSFAHLIEQYDYDYEDTYMLGGGIVSYEEPLHLVLSGGIINSLDDVGFQGHYWSSTTMGGSNAHQFGSYYDGGVWAEGDDVTAYGFSVRCVSR